MQSVPNGSGANEDFPWHRLSIPQEGIGVKSRAHDLSTAPRIVASEPQRIRKRLRIAFVCAGDPENVQTWSGTPMHMLHALRREFDVQVVIRHPWPVWAQFLRKLGRRATSGSIDLCWVPAFTRLAAGHAVAQLLGSDCDLVVAVAVTPICAELVKRLPTVFISDATLNGMVDYNPRFSALLPSLKRVASKLESRCIQNALLALFPSEWASRSALEHHGGARESVLQVPWGANMVAKRVTPPETRAGKQWRLLFVGTNWKGKGGDIALRTVEDMRRRGYDVHIDIVGSSPRERPDIDGVTFHGFLNKRNPADSARIEALFAAAHVFFLPTQFEALGIVFAEAASYAVPSVSYATGGVPGMVKHGTTGVLLPEGSPPSAFADALIELLSDWKRYIGMSHAALTASQEELNWDVWAKRVRQEVEARLAAPITAS